MSTTNKKNAQSIFTCAHIDLHGQRLQNNGRTVRMVQRMNVACSALTFKFANYYGEKTLPVSAVTVAKCDADGRLFFESVTPVTVNHVASFALPIGELIESDMISFSLEPGDYFAVSIYYASNEPVHSGNWIASSAQRSKAGNYTVDDSFPSHNLVSRINRTITMTDLTVAITSLTEIVAYCEQPANVLACFGDSITEQGNWTVPLEKRLHLAYPGQISLCNVGISGNRLLKSSPPKKGLEYGISGIDRFARDVLSISGLTHTIIEIGSNDLGHPGTHGAPLSDLPTALEYSEALTLLAKQLHRKKSKVFAATICPRAVNSNFTEERDAIRKQMNDWIRNATCFDAVLDFDEILRRPDGAPGILEGHVLPDGLHPSPSGGLLMAKAIDISLFGGQ